MKKKKKKKKRGRKENKQEKEINKKKKEEKKREKRKISCLAEKPTCFWKETISNFSLKKFIDHNQFLENVSTPEGWMLEISPDARNGLGWMYKLIKEHILETLGWLK